MDKVTGTTGKNYRLICRRCRKMPTSVYSMGEAPDMSGVYISEPHVIIKCNCRELVVISKDTDREMLRTIATKRWNRMVL